MVFVSLQAPRLGGVCDGFESFARMACGADEDHVAPGAQVEVLACSDLAEDAGIRALGDEVQSPPLSLLDFGSSQLLLAVRQPRGSLLNGA